MSAQQVQAINDAFLLAAMERNYAMKSYTFDAAGGKVDIELDEVPGWLQHLDFNVFVDLAIAVAAGGTAPNASNFSPWNLFSAVQVSIGGGPFQNVSPYFYYLRELAMNPGWNPAYGGPNSYGYASNVYSMPAISAPAGATTDNYWRFPIRVPLQVQEGSAYGLIPAANSKVTVKVRFIVQTQLYGSDQYLNPLYGGSGVTASIGSAQTSYVQPMLWYLTTSPSATQPLQDPTIGYILNVQEQATAFVGAGSETPIKFSNPFRFLRLWHVVEDGTGAPNSSGVESFQLDPAPGYPQWEFSNAIELGQYWYRIRRLYRQDLPTGVFVIDLWSGSDPSNPNGTQEIDARLFQTMRTQLAVSQATNVGSPAKIITYAEALSPVGF